MISKCLKISLFLILVELFFSSIHQFFSTYFHNFNFFQLFIILFIFQYLCTLHHPLKKFYQFRFFNFIMNIFLILFEIKSCIYSENYIIIIQLQKITWIEFQLHCHFKYFCLTKIHSFLLL